VGNSELYTIASPVHDNNSRLDTDVVACQAPLYVHEIHLISSTVDESFLTDTSHYESIVTCYIECLFDILHKQEMLTIKNPLWSVDFVDLYICPKRNKLIYTIQGKELLYHFYWHIQ